MQMVLVSCEKIFDPPVNGIGWSAEHLPDYIEGIFFSDLIIDLLVISVNDGSANCAYKRAKVRPLLYYTLKCRRRCNARYIDRMHMEVHI
jgi:peroxiredoxin